MTEPGRLTLGNRYELHSLLAIGGMGEVWRAGDLRSNRPVAVKVMRSQFTEEPTFLARFRAEARHAGLLAHRNIAALLDYGEDGIGSAHLAYLVMELVEGESLAGLLARERRLSTARTLDILRQTAAALAVAHRAGVVHRDVKPGNVLITRDGLVKIVDFGIARSASSVPLTQTGQLIGTAHYMSPEQAAGGEAGPASDVYSLGMVGYECLAGRRAFDGDSSVQIALRQLRDAPGPLPPDVPDDVRLLIDRALVKDPARRWADAGAFGAAIDDLLAGRDGAPAPADRGTDVFTSPGWAPPPGPPPARQRIRRVLAPLVALLAGAGIAAAGLEVLGGAQPPPAVADGTDPSSVVLLAADYVGRPVGEAEAELDALGFRVELVAQETASSAPGLVTAVTPTGSVRKGDRITLTYAVRRAPAPDSVVPDEAPDDLAPDDLAHDDLLPGDLVPDVVIPEIEFPDVVVPDAVVPERGGGGASGDRQDEDGNADA